VCKPKENLYKASLQTKLRYDSDDVVDDFPSELPMMKLNGTATNKSLLRKLNPFKRKRHSLAPGQELDPQKYIEFNQNGRASISSLSKNYLNHAAMHRPSLYSIKCYEQDEQQDLLEMTTVADLIRALEMFHTDNFVEKNNNNNNSMNSREGSMPQPTRLDTMNEAMSMRQRAQPRKPSLLTLLHKRHHSSHTIHGSSANVSSITTKTAPTKRGRLYSCVTENFYDNSNRRILGDANPFVNEHPPPYSPNINNTSSSDNVQKSELKRRFSVRPSNLDKAPGQFHKVQQQNLPVIPAAPSSSSTLSQPATITSTHSSPASFTRKLSWRPQPSSLAKSNEHE
jgi:hypothetical protein